MIVCTVVEGVGVVQCGSVGPVVLLVCGLWCTGVVAGGGMTAELDLLIALLKVSQLKS